MKKILVLLVVLTVASPGMVMAWDLTGWESANKDRGQWAWFTGQAQQCQEAIPVPGKRTKAEWEKLFTTQKDKFPCGGSGLNERAIKHIYLFLQTHAADGEAPMNQKPESCG